MSSETEDPDGPEEVDVELLGQVYLASKMYSWTEAYRAFDDFVSRFKKEFGKGRMKGDSIALYDEMMELSQEALGVEGDYDDEVYDVQHAFLFGGNKDVEVDEFRGAVTRVLEGEHDWAHYARENQP